MVVQVGWREVLAEAEVVGLADGPRRLRLVLPSGAAGVVRVVEVPGPLRPAWVRARRAGWGAEPVLMAAGSATAAAVDAVREAGWSVVTDNGWMLLQLEGQRLERRPAGRPTRVSRRGPVPWGAVTVVRRLVEAAPLSQTRLAVVSGVGQPQVSKVLAGFQTDGSVVRSAQGWLVPDRGQLLDAWLTEYPG